MSSTPSEENDSAPSNARLIEPSKSIAVALKDQGESAPSVIASGKGFVAEKIIELAFANDVRVREDSDLVQILAAVDVDSPIPTSAFTAVAEILNYLYHTNGTLPNSGQGGTDETR